MWLLDGDISSTLPLFFKGILQQCWCLNGIFRLILRPWIFSLHSYPCVHFVSKWIESYSLTEGCLSSIYWKVTPLGFVLGDESLRTVQLVQDCVLLSISTSVSIVLNYFLSSRLHPFLEMPLTKSNNENEGNECFYYENKEFRTSQWILQEISFWQTARSRK